ERVLRPDPRVRDGLAVVVQRDLLVGRARHEEPRVIATGRTLGRDPVAEVVDAVDSELEPLVVADLDEPPFLLVDRRPMRDEPRLDGRVVEAHHLTVGVVGEQDAGLFEALAHGGDPEREAAALDAEPFACFRVVPPEAVGRQVLVTIVRVDCASGKDVCAADEVGVEVAHQHEDFHAGVAVAHEHHRCRIAHLDHQRFSISGGGPDGGVDGGEPEASGRTSRDVTSRTVPSAHRPVAMVVCTRLPAAPLIRERTGGRNSSNPMAAVTKPGMTRSAPPTAFKKRSMSSFVGTSRCCADRCSVAKMPRPCRFTTQIPMIDSSTSRPIVFHQPIALATHIATPISMIGTAINSNRNTRTTLSAGHRSYARPVTDRPPSIDALARSIADVALPQPLLVDAARAAVAANDPDSARARAEATAHALLQPVINATGVLLHTNLGR